MKKRALELRRSNSSNKEEVQNWMRFLVFFSLRIRGLYALLPVFSQSGCFETVGTKVLEKPATRNSKKLLIPPTFLIFSSFTNFQLHTGSLEKWFLHTFFEKIAKNLFASNAVATGNFFRQNGTQWSKSAEFCAENISFLVKKRMR